MSKINKIDFITELKHNVAAKDAIKARILLEHLPDVEPSIRNQALFELSRGEDEFSLPLLAQLLARVTTLGLDYLSVYTMLHKKLLDNKDFVLELLQDEQLADKKPFIELVGQIRCSKALPLIAHMLEQSSDTELKRLCILTLGYMGDEKYMALINDYLYSPEHELRLSAIQALKITGNELAVKMLWQRLGSKPNLDHIIVDSLGEIQTTFAIRGINKLLNWHDPHLRNYAKDKLMGLGGKALPVLIENLESDDADLLIHTLNILSFIGDAHSAVAIRKLLFKQPADANVRFAAYEALGKLKVKSETFTLIEGLSDSHEQVRLACARALNGSLDNSILVGIKNLIQEGNDDSHDIIKAIIDSESDTLFVELAEYPPFRKRAISFLLNDATQDIREHFEVILRQKGHHQLAGRLSGKKRRVAPQKCNVCVVDDSPLILKIFNFIMQKYGCSTRVYESPENALSAILGQKPDLVFTDLNMPGMNGIELTRRLRKKYAKDVLPIIMVTTQQDMEDRNAAFKAGINDIIYKPFSHIQLQKVIDVYVKKTNPAVA